MYKQTSHSKSSLFLMEMILSVLFLCLACGVCVQLLGAAYTQRRTAREWNRIQEITTTAGEILEGWDGDPLHFSRLFPWEMEETDSQTYESCFDENFSSCGKEKAVYRLTLLPETAPMEKRVLLTFSHIQGEEIYQITIRYPSLESGKEAFS